MPNKSRNNTFYIAVRPIFTAIFKLLYRPTIIGKEYIPTEGAYVLAGNHIHALDPILVDVCTKRVVRTLAKSELFDGAFGWFFRKANCISVDLDAKKNPEALKSAIDALNEGYLVNVSPEAARNLEDTLLPFKPGAVYMSKQTNVKVIPYAIYGEYKLFKKGLTIKFSEPVSYVENSVEEANDLLYKTITNLRKELKDEKTL